ncbi:hypothetical protein BT96DRAFT_927311, partial [Gymnopus androsaceus JB14]
MIMSLPNEFIDCILHNLSSDRNALELFSCRKAWVVPSQRRIFAKIELDGCLMPRSLHL